MYSGSGTLRLNNSGDILSNRAETVRSVASADIVNTGTISTTATTAIDIALDATVRNAGLIVGDGYLGSGVSTFRGAFGTVEGVVNGEAGDDLLLGGAHDDSFHGGGDADIIRGRAGDDTITGGNGRDML